MRDKIIAGVALDLLSIPPLVLRVIRRKLLKHPHHGFENGVTPNHWEIMRLLSEEGEMRSAVIGNRLQVAKAQMTQLVDKLVEMKIAARKTDESDRRTFILSLTDSGRELFVKHKNGVMKATETAMAKLTDEDLEDLSNSLRRVWKILSKLQ